MRKIQNPTMLSGVVPTQVRDDLRAIAEHRDTNVSVEVRRALATFVTSERRRLGLAK